MFSLMQGWVSGSSPANTASRAGRRRSCVHAGVRAWQRGGAGYWGWFCGTLTLILILGLAVLAGLGFDQTPMGAAKTNMSHVGGSSHSDPATRVSTAEASSSVVWSRTSEPQATCQGTRNVRGPWVRSRSLEKFHRATVSKLDVRCVSVGGHVRETPTWRRIGAGAWRSAPTRCMVRDGIARLVAYQ